MQNFKNVKRKLQRSNFLSKLSLLTGKEVHRQAAQAIRFAFLTPRKDIIVDPHEKKLAISSSGEMQLQDSPRWEWRDTKV